MSPAALPVISGREAVRAFEKAGWMIARQRASHIVLVNLTVDEFVNLLK